MEYDLATLPVSPGEPEGYRILPWRNSLIDEHAESKYQSFRFEIDANVFPCLGEREGCRRLMQEIARRPGFLAEATWLLVWQPTESDAPEYCGTIQGIRDRGNYGSVQNLGVTPLHRGRNLGTCLLLKALDGFRSAGLRRAYLEVTAQNTGAVRLYQRLGFRTTKTVYKAVEVAYA
ncbi:MAG: GNAT family N-acetyltransferase [Pirellulaceae bacterium]